MIDGFGATEMTPSISAAGHQCGPVPSASRPGRAIVVDVR
jgi:hypothetical protein